MPYDFRVCELCDAADAAPAYVFPRTTKVHEISFPYRVYLQRILRSSLAARMTAPLADAFFRCIPVRNKIALVARKT